MVIRKSSKSIGLVTKSKAPLFIAPRMFCMSPYAETITARTLGSTEGICSSKVSPSITGMLMSERTISISLSSLRRSSASAPLWAKTNA